MSIEVICGCMFCGKTEELIRRVRRAMVAGLKVRVFKPALDSRYHKTDVVTHYGEKIKGSAVENVAQIFDFSEGYDLIAIDEAQFFPDSILEAAILLSKTKRILISGLDLDSKGRPFGSMGDLMCYADKVTKLYAVCTVCGEDATKTQRITKEKDQIKIGSFGDYEARCNRHWKPQ